MRFVPDIKCLDKHQGQILRLRPPKGQKGKKNIIVRNLCLNKIKEFCEYIVACQAHTALVKIGLILACIFHFNGLLVCIRLVKALRTKA